MKDVGREGAHSEPEHPESMVGQRLAQAAQTVAQINSQQTVGLPASSTKTPKHRHSSLLCSHISTDCSRCWSLTAMLTCQSCHVDSGLGKALDPQPLRSHTDLGSDPQEAHVEVLIHEDAEGEGTQWSFKGLPFKKTSQLLGQGWKHMGKG